MEQWRERGGTRKDLADALRMGTVRRITRGWYAAPTADHRVTAAIAAGARIGCLTGTALYRLWTPPTSITHVIIPGKRSMAGSAGLLIHREPIGALCRSAVHPLPDCLAHVVRHHDAETALMVLEPAVANRQVPEWMARDAIAACQDARKAIQLARFDPGAASGTETRVRLFLQTRGVQVQTQVQILGVGRVDLVVGDSLIIELDSRAHHTGTEANENDRRRDLAARRLGYETIRLTYGQVFNDWPATQQVLSELLARRIHRRRLAAA